MPDMSTTRPSAATSAIRVAVTRTSHAWVGSAGQLEAPICPPALLPQPQTEPSSSSASVYCPPVESFVARRCAGSPVTCTGVGESAPTLP